MFQSTPARVGRLDLAPRTMACRCFNPRPHAWTATWWTSGIGNPVSTTPPRGRLRPPPSSRGFKSTPPPHPWGGRRAALAVQTVDVSIHALGGGRRVEVAMQLASGAPVSIHAHLTRGDAEGGCTWTHNVVFQSTPPSRGGRPAQRETCGGTERFQSTPPPRGRPFHDPARRAPLIVSIHAPASPGGGNKLRAMTMFQSTPSRGGADSQLCPFTLMCTFQSTPHA